ncbi:MAG: RNA polymerase sigma-70 factor [Tannerellaceae bacterium]|jgi:RNA polymerase sigma-70 factor (ECF subfamily)|nr:RNA polymerase sigma-70 factor [Tannerellaceae bacterium]
MSIENITSLNELYRNYNERFVRFARTYVSSKETAEDIVMESFMSYYENRAKLPPGSNVPAYITTLIKNRCLNHLNRLHMQEEVRKRLTDIELWELQVRIATLEACNPEKLFSLEVQQIIGRALGSLPAKTCEVFLRSRYHGESHKTIAHSLGISEKSVEYHITRALKILRAALKDY